MSDIQESHLREATPPATVATRGRGETERHPAGLDAFALDRHRVIHCAAFRRLQHKTQVFVTHEGDHFRTRLTHTLEVASVAARLARELNLNQALAETIALAHDLGHPPFGHAGEAALQECMRDHGGFEHNHQSLRVVDYLEHPYPDFRGLNLTLEVREGLLKHCTRYDQPLKSQGAEHADLLTHWPMPTLEAQAANLADEIAYTLHDIEDGLMVQLLDEARLNALPLWREAAGAWRRRFPDAPIAAIRRPVIDALLQRLATDAGGATRAAVAAAGVREVDDARQLRAPVLVFSAALREELDSLQRLLKECVYSHRVVREMDAHAQGVVRAVFGAYVARPELLPQRFAARMSEAGAHRVVCDYVAGMTDRYCEAEWKRHCAGVLRS